MTKDNQIWDDFRKGKSYALSHIYYQNVQLLYRYGKKFCKDDELVKDTIQDLFFDLIRTRTRLGATDNIQFYLIRSFRRKLARNVNVLPKTSPEYEQNLPEAQIVYSVEQDFIGKEELSRREKLVQKGLKELSPKQREILFYKFTCEFEYDQICEIMQLKYDSARKLVFRALKGLKEALSDKNLLLLFTAFFSKKTIRLHK
jgi:RNA polymerase sigma factor (sigma-70 family)